MTVTKDSSSLRQSGQNKAVANNTSTTGISLPAVPLIAEQKQKEEADKGNEQVQLKLQPAGTETSGSPADSAGNPTDIPDPSRKARQSVQYKLKNTVDSDSDVSRSTSFNPVQKKNDTGLPDNLKSGIENVSGFSMDDVKVHYNSAKPAQLQALAYAQGTDIHVGPGQEKHLAHEAWHVVQQKQGRVRPTFQMKQGIPVNDDAGLENEADVMGAKALQTTGNEGIAQRMRDNGGASAATAPVQMTSVSIIGVKIGKTRIYNGKGTAVGHIAKGTIIDVDEGVMQTVGSRTLVQITSGQTGILWNNPDALLNDEDDIWISHTRFRPVGGEEESGGEAAPMAVSIPLFGQNLNIGKDSAELSGEIGQSIAFETPAVSLSFDFPLPVPGVYATVGLGVGMNFELGVAGAYDISASPTGQKVNVNATANGSAAMDVNVNVGAGAGIANIAGIEGGLFAGAKSQFAVEGSISGEVSHEAAKAWAASTLELKLSSSASLVGSAGTYIKAKILNFSKEKKFKLLEREFAKWEFERTRSIQKAGVTVRDIIPTVADFKLMLEGHEPGYFAVEENVSETASLLGSAERSD